jgi:cytochrome c6
MKELESILKHAICSVTLIVALFFAGRAGLAQNTGAGDFKAKCAACHGDDGLAASPMAQALGVKSYKAPDVLKLSDIDLTAIIKNGKKKMPAFAGKLTDAQIKDLLLYIHTLQKK